MDRRISLQDCIMSYCINAFSFVSAIPGALIFGEVEFFSNQICYVSERVIIIPIHKLFPFLSLLRDLARSFVLENMKGPFRAMKYDTVTISVFNFALCFQSPHYIYDFKLSRFSFFQFMTGLRNCCLFSICPSRQEFQIINTIIASASNNCNGIQFTEADLQPILQTFQHDTILLEQFVLNNKNLIRFYYEISDLIME